MKTIAVFLQPGAQWDPEKPVREQPYWDDHARFMDALFDAGKVVLGGPFADRRGTMLILAVESEEEARSLFQNDPWTLRDILLVVEAREWAIFLDRCGYFIKRELEE